MKVLAAFEEQMLKAAISPLASASATLGVLGAGVGGAREYMKAKEEGQGTGGALRNALSGAATGGLLGAGAGAGLHALKPDVAGSIGRFGQRQVHALTGWTPQGGIRAGLRDGAFDAAERLHAAQKNLSELHGGSALLRAGKALPAGHAFHGKTLQEISSALPDVQKELTRAHEGYEAMNKAESMGLTSIPGVFRSVKEHGLLPTIGAGFNAQIKGTSGMDKALQLGLPALGMASALRGGAGPDEEGRGRAERVGEQVGQLVGGIAGSPVPVVGQMLLGEGAGRVGRFAGKMVDRFSGSQPIPASGYQGELR